MSPKIRYYVIRRSRENSRDRQKALLIRKVDGEEKIVAMWNPKNTHPKKLDLHIPEDQLKRLEKEVIAIRKEEAKKGFPAYT